MVNVKKESSNIVTYIKNEGSHRGYLRFLFYLIKHKKLLACQKFSIITKAVVKLCSCNFIRF